MTFNLSKSKIENLFMKNILLPVFFLIGALNSGAQSLVTPADTTLRDTIFTQVTTDTIKNVQDTFPSKKHSGKVYRLNPWADIPVTAAAAGWSAFAFTQIYSKPPSTVEQINALNKNNIPKIDRWAAGMHDENADANSNYFFYGSIPVPFFLFFDKGIRKEAGKISFMYLEAMSVTGMFYTGTVFFVDRYRPETYDTSIPAEERTGGNYKDAFLAGHPALVATSLFFTAKVYHDFHPGSGFQYALYGLAIAGTGATVYLRHIAGKHFPTDLFTGVTLGTLSGTLIPQLHKIRNNKSDNVSLLPFYYDKIKGINFAYRF